MKRQSGFTLVEVIVVAGIIAILAGILVPLILKEIDESRISRATADVRSISNALIVFKKDLGQWPVSTTCEPAVTLLQSAGTVPALGLNWDGSNPGNLDDYLASDSNGCWPAKWKGPYMAFASADPWGNAYVINGKDFLSATGALWIISAGPDGVVDTASTQTSVGGDDIGLRLR